MEHLTYIIIYSNTLCTWRSCTHLKHRLKCSKLPRYKDSVLDNGRFRNSIRDRGSYVRSDFNELTSLRVGSFTIIYSHTVIQSYIIIIIIVQDPSPGQTFENIISRTCPAHNNMIMLCSSRESWNYMVYVILFILLITTCKFYGPLGSPLNFNAKHGGETIGLSWRLRVVRTIIGFRFRVLVFLAFLNHVLRAPLVYISQPLLLYFQVLFSPFDSTVLEPNFDLNKNENKSPVQLLYAITYVYDNNLQRDHQRVLRIIRRDMTKCYIIDKTTNIWRVRCNNRISPLLKTL